MRKFCLLLILSLALPVFCLLQAVEPPKKEIRAVWLTTVYGLDWPHKPATTEAGRKAQQQALLDILDRLQEANFNMVFIQARLRGDVMYRSAIEPNQ
ncbi:family 10 glycosylhydrolase [Parabacteroides distasonis]|nr:family 10 glycosylhydrolase [Parabacteroides distasonis]